MYPVKSASASSVRWIALGWVRGDGKEDLREVRDVRSGVGSGGTGGVYVQTDRSFSLISEKQGLVVRVCHSEFCSCNYQFTELAPAVKKIRSLPDTQGLHQSSAR